MTTSTLSTLSVIKYTFSIGIKNRFVRIDVLIIAAQTAPGEMMNVHLRLFMDDINLMRVAAAAAADAEAEDGKERAQQPNYQ